MQGIGRKGSLTKTSEAQAECFIKMTWCINCDITARAEGGGEATKAVPFGGYLVTSGVTR